MNTNEQDYKLRKVHTRGHCALTWPALIVKQRFFILFNNGDIAKVLTMTVLFKGNADGAGCFHRRALPTIAVLPLNLGDNTRNGQTA